MCVNRNKPEVFRLPRQCSGARVIRVWQSVDLRSIAEKTTWTKPPYFGRTIALWRLYSAFSVNRSRWTGTSNGSITPPCFRRLRCGAIVLTKYTVALGTAAKRLRPSVHVGSCTGLSNWSRSARPSPRRAGRPGSVTWLPAPRPIVDPMIAQDRFRQWESTPALRESSRRTLEWSCL